MTSEAMTIGRFSKRSGLSQKALRLYDELGLLPPATIDDRTGYRMYTESQLETARLISHLRRLDVPLAEIARITSTDRHAGALMLGEWWHRLELEMESRRDLMQYVLLADFDEEAVRNDLPEQFDIHIREVPATAMLVQRRHVTGPTLVEFLRTAEDELRAYAVVLNLQAGGAIATYYGQVTMDSDGPVEVGLPISGDLPENGVPQRVHRAAFQEAYVAVPRRQVTFPQILVVYEAVRQWTKREGFEIIGPPREAYVNEFATASPDDIVCEIGFPVSKKEVTP